MWALGKRKILQPEVCVHVCRLAQRVQCSRPPPLPSSAHKTSFYLFFPKKPLTTNSESTHNKIGTRKVLATSKIPLSSALPLVWHPWVTWTAPVPCVELTHAADANISWPLFNTVPYIRTTTLPCSSTCLHTCITFRTYFGALPSFITFLFFNSRFGSDSCNNVKILTLLVKKKTGTQEKLYDCQHVLDRISR